MLDGWLMSGGPLLFTSGETGRLEVEPRTSVELGPEIRNPHRRSRVESSISRRRLVLEVVRPGTTPAGSHGPRKASRSQGRRRQGTTSTLSWRRAPDDRPHGRRRGRDGGLINHTRFIYGIDHRVPGEWNFWSSFVRHPGRWRAGPGTDGRHPVPRSIRASGGADLGLGTERQTCKIKDGPGWTFLGGRVAAWSPRQDQGRSPGRSPLGPRRSWSGGHTAEAGGGNHQRLDQT